MSAPIGRAPGVPGAPGGGGPPRPAATAARAPGGYAVPSSAVPAPTGRPAAAGGVASGGGRGPVTGAADGGRRTRAPRRPPRLASLQLKRVDPWTALKISLIVSIVMFFVWMIAVGVLYLSLESMGVWTKINTTYNTLIATSDTVTGGADLITPGTVFTVTAVVGAVNVVLFTALATIAAFVYNAAAGMAGGVELTLGERD